MQRTLVSAIGAALMLAACASAPGPAVSQAADMPTLDRKDAKEWQRAERDIRKGEKRVAQASDDIEKYEVKVRKERTQLRKAEDRLADAKVDLGKAQRQVAEGVATQSALTSRAVEPNRVEFISAADPGA